MGVGAGSKPHRLLRVSCSIHHTNEDEKASLSSIISPLTAPGFKSPPLSAAALGMNFKQEPWGTHANQSSSASGNSHSSVKTALTEVAVIACSSLMNTDRERDLGFTLYNSGCTQPFFANFVLRFNYVWSRGMVPSHHATWRPFCLPTSSCSAPLPPILLGTRLALSPTPLLP